jgi:hypothetical protein
MYNTVKRVVRNSAAELRGSAGPDPAHRRRYADLSDPSGGA